MADVEAIMWLQFGVELGVFSAEAVQKMCDRAEVRASISYVLEQKIPIIFKDEIEIFSSHIQAKGIPFADHPRRIREGSVVDGVSEMLFHEVERVFRDPQLTISLALNPPDDFHARLRGKIDPDALLNSELLDDTNVLLSDYLRFLGHAGGMQQLWDYLETVSDTGYTMANLRQRVRAMHNWRLDLETPEVLERFIAVTKAFIDGAREDEQLQGLGVKPDELLARIQDICSSWNGDDTILIDTTIQGDSDRGAKGGERAVKSGGAEEGEVEDDAPRKRPRAA